MKTRNWTFIVVLTLASGILSAQETKLGLGPVVGFQKSSGAEEANMMLGAALRMKLSPGFGLEGSINYNRERHKGGSMITKSWPVKASVLLYPVRHVYGTLGAGWYNTTFEFVEDGQTTHSRTKQEFGWHLGGGVEFPFSETASLIGDIRYTFIDYDIEEIVGLDERVRSNFYVISIGLLIGL